MKLCNIRPDRTQIVSDREHTFLDLLYIVCRRVGEGKGAASCLSRHLSYLSVAKTLSKHTNNILNIKQKYTQHEVDVVVVDDDERKWAGRRGGWWCCCCPSKQKIKAQENLN